MSLISRVHIRICPWIHEEIGAIESIHMGAVIVVDSVRIEEFAGVVGVIAGFLKPDRQEIIVKPPINEFGVAT
jgi:hypothetical protein